MSLVLRMVHRNFPLHQWERFVDGADGLGFRFGSKNPDKEARLIFNQLSHPKVVDLLAKEFANLPEQMRIQIRTLAGSGNATGNVRKGVARLNDLLRGALLREEKFVQVTSRRVEGPNGVRFKKEAVNPAIAGAARKYAMR